MSALIVVRVGDSVTRINGSPLIKVTRGRVLRAPARGRPFVRDTTERLTTRLTRALSNAQRALRPSLLRAVAKLVKADDEGAIDDALSDVDFSVLSQLPDSAQTELEAVYADAGAEALRLVGASVSAKLPADALEQINEAAAEYAEARAAEMVGMRRVEGKLVPNPNARWRIDEPTRDGVRRLITQAARGELTVNELPGALRSAYDFSAERAGVIARTELARANGEGSMGGFKASGYVEYKVWLTADDGDVSEDCQDNEDAGPILIDDTFPSGDDTEPAHPNCRCATAAYVNFDEEE